LLLFAALALAVGPPAVIAEEVEGTGVRMIYLIRHGEYDHEDERDEEIGRALVPLGVAQARLVAARLRAMPVEWTSLTSSTMTRARETAQVIADELPQLEHVTDRKLSECLQPTWRTEITAEETLEDLAACLAQQEAAYEAYFQPSPAADRHDIIVGHGNVIRHFVTRVLKVDPMSWLEISIGNCSLTVVNIQPDGSMKLLSYGDVGHIPPGLQTRTPPGVPRDLSVPQP
jgi:serine/threonine-protein phosphatase PGAM5